MIFMVIWPILMPLGYVMILFRARRAIIERKPNRLSHACAFLHGEYEPEVRSFGAESSGTSV